MTCQNCNKDFADGFAFCPHCGNAVKTVSSAATPVAEIKAAPMNQTDTSSTPEKQSHSGGYKVGTIVFASFAALCLLVFIIKGLIPIYGLEAFVWTGAAWFWQKKRVETSFAKGVFVCLAVVVAFCEVALMFNSWHRAEEYNPGYSSTATVPAYIQPAQSQPQPTTAQQSQPVVHQAAKGSTPHALGEKKAQTEQRVSVLTLAEEKKPVASSVS